MPQGTKICKVCGKTYPYCRTNRPAGTFRWQEVACCPEHGTEYFIRVLKSRGESIPSSLQTEPVNTTATVLKSDVQFDEEYIVDEDEDDWDEDEDDEWYDDEDDEDI